MRKINKIIIHCSATREGQDIKTETIRGWHVDGNGWSDIGYHFCILLDGTIDIGRPIERSGAHTIGENKNSIGVCYIGGVDKDLKPKDTRTDLQKLSLLNLMTVLKEIYPEVVVHGHRDFSSKACPSFDATNEYKDI
jgi:N-acetylmuramoyl-L-alanine amidase